MSCRNLLIYLTSDAQHHVLAVMHFALTAEGHLFLSSSESPGSQRELFSAVSKSHRIYCKLGASRPVSLARSRCQAIPEREGASLADRMARRPRVLSGTELARGAVLRALVPPRSSSPGTDRSSSRTGS